LVDEFIECVAINEAAFFIPVSMKITIEKQSSLFEKVITEFPHTKAAWLHFVILKNKMQGFLPAPSSIDLNSN
jgi:hypothetical protein